MTFKVFRYIGTELKLILALSVELKRLIISVAVLTTVFEVIKIVPPAIFKETIDHLLTVDFAVSGYGKIIQLLVLYLVALMAMNILDIFGERVVSQGILRSEMDILEKVLRKLLALDLRYHEQNETGRSVSRLLRGQGRINELMWHLNLSLLPAIAQSLLTVAILFYVGWQLGVVFIITVPIFLALMINGGEQTQPLREAYYRHFDEFSGSVVQSLVNIRTVKDFNAEAYELNKAKKHLGAYKGSYLSRMKVGFAHLFYEDIIVSIGRVLTLGVGVWLFVVGRLSAGNLVFVMTLTEKAFLTLLRIHRAYFFVQDAEPAVTQFHKLLNTSPAIKPSPNSAKQITQGKIEFRNVRFTYIEGKAEALNGIDMTIAPRQSVAFVGRSGSGKSTLVRLILRHFDPTHGTVLLDDHPLTEYSREGLGNGIAVVSQDVELFNDTVSANIAYGLEGVTEDELLAATKAAAAHDFISNLVNGYDTLIGERGIKLSGGQKQRLAIARALLRRPKILIFDEATSSLDAEAERYIQNAIDQLIGKVTIIIIAHRFATIERAEMIYLLENGEILEQGKQKELLAKDGIYRKLRELQRIEC